MKGKSATFEAVFHAIVALQSCATSRDRDPKALISLGSDCGKLQDRGFTVEDGSSLALEFNGSQLNSRNWNNRQVQSSGVCEERRISECEHRISTHDAVCDASTDSDLRFQRRDIPGERTSR